VLIIHLGLEDLRGQKIKMDRDWIAVSCEGEGARIWWPNKDHITEEPDSVRMAYTVPSNLVAVGNGQLRNIRTKDNKTTYEWFVIIQSIIITFQFKLETM
jgi:hypothetical protein